MDAVNLRALKGLGGPLCRFGVAGAWCLHDDQGDGLDIEIASHHPRGFTGVDEAAEDTLRIDARIGQGKDASPAHSRRAE
jgi:hypothetical protein